MISIVIPLYNRWELTEACLAAIHATSTEVEIITVDNGSTDATRLHDASVRNPRNRGYAVACNQGARRAAGDVLGFLNNDTIPHPEWLDPFRQVEGIAGPKLVYPDGTIQSAGVGVDFTRPPGQEAWNRREEHAGGDVQAVTGACLVVSRTCWNHLGGFDEEFWNGYEDVDLCLRAAQAGFPVTYHPDSVVTHLESQSDAAERFRCAEQNIVRLRERWSE
jgi:GT2 family glycosyltransferase